LGDGEFGRVGALGCGNEQPTWLLGRKLRLLQPRMSPRPRGTRGAGRQIRLFRLWLSMSWRVMAWTQRRAPSGSLELASSLALCLPVVRCKAMLSGLVPRIPAGTMVLFFAQHEALPPRAGCRPPLRLLVSCHQQHVPRICPSQVKPSSKLSQAPSQAGVLPYSATKRITVLRTARGRAAPLARVEIYGSSRRVTCTHASRGRESSISEISSRV
jgi:hypothetical protein